MVWISCGRYAAGEPYFLSITSVFLLLLLSGEGITRIHKAGRVISGHLNEGSGRWVPSTGLIFSFVLRFINIPCKATSPAFKCERASAPPNISKGNLFNSSGTFGNVQITRPLGLVPPPLSPGWMMVGQMYVLALCAAHNISFIAS